MKMNEMTEDQKDNEFSRISEYVIDNLKGIIKTQRTDKPDGIEFVDSRGVGYFITINKSWTRWTVNKTHSNLLLISEDPQEVMDFLIDLKGDTI